MGTPSQLLPNVRQQWLDSNGLPLAGGKLYSYAATTVTPLATYTDQTGNTANANPVILDSTGTASVWLGPSAYKLKLTDSLNNVLWTVDKVSIINPASIDKTKIAANIAGVALNQNGTGAIDTQVDDSTIEVNGSNQLRVKDGGITSAKISNSAMVEVVFKNKFDCTGPGIHGIPQYPWTSPALSSPSSLTLTGNTAVKWSPNGEFLAILGGDGSYYLTVYQRIGTSFAALASPTFNTGVPGDLFWSPDSTFLAIAHATTPYITIYQRSGTTFTKLSNPGTIPAGACSGVAFSPNGEFLAVAMSSSGTVHMYKINGTTFTHLTSPVLSSGLPTKLAWSPDGHFLGVCGDTTPFVNIFQRTDEAFALLSDPGTLPLADTSFCGIAFSPDNKFLVLGQTVSPYIIIYSQSAGVFTKITDPSSLPPSQVKSVSFSPNSLYMAVAHTTTPYFTIYSISGTTFTKLSNPSSLSAGGGAGCEWSPDGQFLAMAVSNSPYLQAYQTASVMPTNALLWVRSVLNV